MINHKGIRRIIKNHKEIDSSSCCSSFRLSCVGVDREPSQCSLKYGRFQACVPVVVSGGGVLWVTRSRRCFLSLGVECISFCCPPIFDCFALAYEHDGPGSIVPLPTPPFSVQSNLVLPFPKATGIPGGHQWSSFRGKPCWLLGGLLCTGSRGRRQCLINWLGVLGRVQEFAEGGDGEVGMRDELGGGDRGRFPVHQGWFIQPQIMSVWFTRLKVVGNVLIIWLDRCKDAADALIHSSFLTFREVYRSHQMWSNSPLLFTW